MPKPTLVDDQKTSFDTTTSPKSVTVSWLAGDVIVWTGQCEGYNTSGDNVVLTPTATGLTFAEQQAVAVSDYGYVRVMTAVAAGSGSSVSVSTEKTGNNSGYNMAWGASVKVWRGSDGVGASSKTNVSSGAPSLDLTTTQVNSAVQVANNDWNATDGASRTWRTVNSVTPTSGNGLETNYFRDAARYTTYAAYYDDVGTAGTKTVGLSAPSGQKYSIVAIEIKGTAGGGTVHNVSIAESASATDALDQGAPFDDDVFDFDVFDMDPVGGSGTHNVSVAETGSGSDTLSAIATLVRSLTETGAATDTPSAARASPVAVAEAGAATDTPSATGVFPRSVAETGAAADAPSAAYTAVASIAEAGTAADTVSAIATLAVTISEAGSATDQVASGATTHSVTVTETGTAADAVSRTLQAAAAVAETGTASEVVSAVATLVAAVAEAGSATDSVASGATVHTVNVAETGSAADTVSAAAIFARAVAEVATAADTYTAQAARVAQLVEAGNATDALSVAATLLASLVEVAVATDQVDWIVSGGPAVMLVVTADGRDRRFVVGWHDGRLLVSETTDRQITTGPRQDTQATDAFEGLMRPPRLH
jgi:hypothetical protein